MLFKTFETIELSVVSQNVLLAFGRESVERRFLFRPRTFELSRRFEGRADILEASRTRDEDQVEASSGFGGVQSRGKAETGNPLKQHPI